jgi:hypothetical protein
MSSISKVRFAGTLEELDWGCQRAKRGAQFWLDGTEIAADYFGVGILLCWEFSELNPY